MWFCSHVNCTVALISVGTAVIARKGGKRSKRDSFAHKKPKKPQRNNFKERNGNITEKMRFENSECFHNE